MNLKIGTTLGLVAFGAMLSYSLIDRLSADALNLVVGLACGVVASVPASLGLLIALNREKERGTKERQWDGSNYASAFSPGTGRPSQVIVIPPPNGAFIPSVSQSGYPAAGSWPYASFVGGQVNDVIEDRDWRLVGVDE